MREGFMPRASTHEGSISSLTKTLNQVLEEQLPKLWAARGKPPVFFEDGINWISVSVKAGLAEVTVSVGGRAAPPAGALTPE
jgi:hypothetical protein